MPNRVDTKFVLTLEQLSLVLKDLSADYSALEIGGVRRHRYRTLYFDTEGFALYLDHHAGARNSYKVRSRLYVDSDRSFLEIKKKTRPCRTLKTRRETPAMATEIAPVAARFIEAHSTVDSRRLQPVLLNQFERISLVSKTHRERLTLDVNLEFGQAGRDVEIPGIAVAELKQETVDRGSAFFRAMRAMRVRPTGFSKYCIGVSLLVPTVKHNRFKPKLRMLQGMTGGLRVGR